MDAQTPLPSNSSVIEALFGQMTVVQAIFWILAIVALIGAVVKLWKPMNQFTAIINATVGLPAYIARADARGVTMDEKIKEIEDKINGIHHEVNYNNGTSVKDAVDRVELGVRGLYKQIEVLARTDDELRREIEDTATIRRIGDQDGEGSVH